MGTVMTVWKQLGLALIAVLAALALWVAFVPATAGLLSRIGLTPTLQQIGLLAATPVSAANPPARVAEAVQVVAAPATNQVMRDIVTSIGTARGARSVVLATEVAGQVVTLNAAAGDYVKAGSVIAELDSSAAQIALDRATLILGDAQTTSDRLARLKASGATTDLQTQEAELALKTAELNFRDATLEVSRHKVLAPISGWLGILAVEPGGRVSQGQEMTRIEDRSTLIVDFRVPERIVSRLRIGDPVTATPLADMGQTLPAKIIALDNIVDEASRSLLVQAGFANPQDQLRAGMAFSITLEFSGDSLPAVDPLAIQWGSDGAYVWIVRDAKAQRLPARIQQRNSDAVLISAAFEPGDLVVTEGVQALRPGTPVTVVGQKPALAVPKT